MTHTNPIFAICVLATAILTAIGIARFSKTQTVNGHFATIDGLRGYLAFFVFIHHASVWFFYLRTGEWKIPPSHFYTHLGQASVVLFFMITGFLFFTKLYEAKATKFDFCRFFISRALRLFPLYIFSLALLFLIVAHQSGWILTTSPWSLIKTAIKWMTFTIAGAPDINAVADTWIIMAGVTWSLPYEWFFYFALPLLALTVRIVPPAPYLIVSIASVFLAVFVALDAKYLFAFAGGIAAALLVTYSFVKRLAVLPIAPFLVFGSLAVVISEFPTAYGYSQITLITLSFTLIAGGCTLFGALANRAATALGSIAFSIYLLHGIVLFCMIKLFVGEEKVRQMSPEVYWLFICSVTPVLLLFSFTTFRLIEFPAMRLVSKLTYLVHERLSPRDSFNINSPVHKGFVKPLP